MSFIYATLPKALYLCISKLGTGLHFRSPVQRQIHSKQSNVVSTKQGLKSLQGFILSHLDRA